MKYTALYIVITLSLYLLDKQFNRPLIQSTQIIGDCQYKLFPQIQNQEASQKCIFCIPSRSEQIAFRLDSSYSHSEAQWRSDFSSQQLYQRECREHRCRDIVNVTDYKSFPAVVNSIQAQTFLMNYTFAEIENIEPSHSCRGGSCSTILQIDSSNDVHSFAILVNLRDYELQDNLSASFHSKDYNTYYFDLIAQALTLVGIYYFLTIKPLQNANHQLDYMYFKSFYPPSQDNKLSIVVSLVSIMQPLRFLNFSRVFRNIEWVVDGTAYTVAVLFIYFKILQLVQISKNQDQTKTAVFISLIMREEIIFQSQQWLCLYCLNAYYYNIMSMLRYWLHQHLNQKHLRPQ